ncbi:efflux RND transporter permease subunit [Polyangium aurulentum]|uniref:efflux RND transporter permease subunit n=1 Tax=Polyangium aurulentum TaxID=2567896 RepID=UPI0010AE6E37|nr:efflux RND transporter permease subunit [Polyangium aurulentum]UQA57186.1 efflux RND transporter permease subunit [Polyangium aurulentum]
MWLVVTALKRPYTFIVMSMLIVIMGVFTILRMPTDIFPEIDIPVISVIFNYGGLPPEEMEKRVVNNYERFLTTVVNDIDHVESQALTGIAIVKVYLQPGASVEAATAQITAASQVAIRQMPPGMTPPLVIRYSASSVPIMQAALESESLSEQQLFDYGVNFIRADIATIKGVQIPWPYGGKQRQIMVDIDPQRLFAWGLSPRDVNAAIGLQNVILPAGSAKMGENEYPILMNSSPAAVEELGALPIKTVNGKTIYVRDVANIRDGNAPQQSMVHVGGQRSVLMTMLKGGSASTLDVASRIRDTLPRTMERLPKELRATLLFDQSLFVRAAVDGVVHEAVIAAVLTALMILLFLGSWRSTLIVIISIPLSILVSIIILDALGHTLNTMTLGGMALAVGILVDDATVAIENIHRNLGQRKPFIRAIVDGAQEIAVPALVATLCICIVFVPVTFITGAARSLFVPLALAVVFAMLMSYVLSRTLVPTLVRLLLEREAEEHAHGHHEKPRSVFGRIFARFNSGFDRLRTSYGRLLAWTLAHRAAFVTGFLAFVALSVSLLPLLGQDFFPRVDAGLIKLHVRGAPGTRLEESERHFARIEDTIREVIPPAEIQTMIDNIGIPASGINLSLSEGALISSADGQILIALEHGHQPTDEYVRRLRGKLNATYPGSTFFFLAPDITTQVLNFGLPAPINVRVVGPIGKEDETYGVAEKIAARMKSIPGAVDVHLAQVTNRPQLNIEVDRTMADQMGLTQRDVASDVLVSLSSSGQVSPSYWLDKRGVQYLVAVQTPQYAMGSLDAVKATPLATGDGQPQLLSNVAQVSRGSGPVNVTHYNVARTFDVQANVDGTDLGSVASAVKRVVDGLGPELPRGTKVTVTGQVESMESSFRGLSYGLIFAVVLVYLLMVVNFQSWLDPLVILMALPGAIAGIVWMLFLTRTTLSVPALMGAIMCVGVATANSILVVTFANDQRGVGRDAVSAALAAGMTRLRPVLMTALAMIIGMLPMSLGIGEGGEQNAPLGRAVIGGLLVATLTTLFFVPVMYSLLRKKAPAKDPLAENL